MNGRRIINGSFGRKMRNQFLVDKLVQRKAICRVASTVISSQIGDNATIHFQLDITDKILFLLLAVLVLKIQTSDISFRNHVCPQSISQCGNDGSRYHIRTHQTLEAHPRGHHRDDFRILSQFRSEENYRNEHEQRTEQIGKIGDEVHVIIKYDRLYRRIVIDELVYVFIDVEDNGNADNQRNRKEISPQELDNDITVKLPDKLVHLQFLAELGHL